jgi:cytochrome P450
VGANSAAVATPGSNGSTSPSGSPPGPRTPGVVQTLSWMYRPVPFVERCRERYGRIFSLRLGPERNAVVVAEPDAAWEIAAGSPEIYSAGDANGIMRPVVGPDSLLVLDGEKHRIHRRILSPAVGAQHARAFAEQIEQIARDRISRWRPGQTLRLQDEMEAISLDVIMGVVLGDAQESTRSQIRALIPEMMRRCSSPFTLLPYFRRELGGISPYARLRGVLDRLDELFRTAIAERRAAPAPGGDVLSLLLAATDGDGAPLPDGEVRDELLTMIMAGYETTSTALAWAFERLLRAPEILEQTTRAAEAGDGSYLDAVANESLRARPVVPALARKTRQDVVVGGFSIPAGSVLMVSVYLLHMDPELFAEPTEFRPERFLDPDLARAPWMPFGAGARRCLGASFAQVEMQVVLRAVLTSARLRPVGRGPEPVARRRFTFAPARGAKVRVERLRAPGA